MQMKTSAAVKRDRIIINILPVILASIAFSIIWNRIKDAQLIEENAGLGICSTMIGVWATCLGFMITAVSVLLALNNGSYIEMLKKTGHYNTILISYVSCCFHLLVALAIVMIFTFMQTWSSMVFAILCASTIDVMIIMGISLYFLLIIVIKIKD